MEPEVDEVAEPQQSLFSWAEFLAAESLKRQSRNPKLASTSSIEWVRDLELERDEALVGAGH